MPVLLLQTTAADSVELMAPEEHRHIAATAMHMASAVAADMAAAAEQHVTDAQRTSHHMTETWSHKGGKDVLDPRHHAVSWASLLNDGRRCDRLRKKLRCDSCGSGLDGMAVRLPSENSSQTSLNSLPADIEIVLPDGYEPKHAEGLDIKCDSVSSISHMMVDSNDSLSSMTAAVSQDGLGTPYEAVLLAAATPQQLEHAATATPCQFDCQSLSNLGVHAAATVNKGSQGNNIAPVVAGAPMLVDCSEQMLDECIDVCKDQLLALEEKDAILLDEEIQVSASGHGA